jgi:hypothetical protein
MTSQKAIATSRSTTVCRLSAPEQLLVWTFRHRAFGGAYWRCASAELRSHLSEDRAECLVRALDRLVVTACLRARRTLTFHRLDCHCLGADELSLLTIVAATQYEEVDLARATSRWLVQSSAIDSLVEDAQAVANIFEAQGWWLPLRKVRGPKPEGDDVERLPRRVLH